MPQPATGYKVLVVGLGPAGFTLAHHLMNDGHTVVGVDGLKIEPLAGRHLGRRRRRANAFRSGRFATSPSSTSRSTIACMAGFGGVAEYGITVRWNKNFLKVIRLLLERRREFAMFGGVRFGGTLTLDSAFEHGLRPRRALHGRGPADRHPDEERPGARRPPGVGLPDGAAVDRRGQDGLDREPAGAHARRRDRRRT